MEEREEGQKGEHGEKQGGKQGGEQDGGRGGDRGEVRGEEKVHELNENKLYVKISYICEYMT